MNKKLKGWSATRQNAQTNLLETIPLNAHVCLLRLHTSSRSEILYPPLTSGIGTYLLHMHLFSCGPKQRYNTV